MSAGSCGAFVHGLEDEFMGEWAGRWVWLVMSLWVSGKVGVVIVEFMGEWAGGCG